MGREPAGPSAQVSGHRYEIRVSGRLPEHLYVVVRDFGGLQIEPAGTETLVYGAFADQARLCELVRLCGGLGLSVRSLRRVPEVGAGG